MKGRLFLFIISSIAVLSTSALMAQSEKSLYKIHAALDIPTLSIAGVGSVSARLMQRQIEPLSGIELSHLSTSNIPAIDLSAHSRWSPRADKISNLGTYAAMLSPGLLFFSPSVHRKDWGTIILLSAETFAMTDFTVQMTKSLVLRPRPFLYNPDVIVPESLLKDNMHRFSMMSGSTAYASAMCFTGASLFSAYHPNASLKPYVWAAAAIIPTVIGFLRYQSGHHYPTDIFVGYAVGTGIGLAIPYIHKKATIWFQ